MSKSQYIYQISTNPIIQENPTVFLQEEESCSFGFIGDFSVVTGMNDSVNKTIDAIKNSLLVYITGEIDATTFFELGLAVSLEKKIYYVTDKQQNLFDVHFPYDLSNLEMIDYKSFMNVIEEL